MKKFKLFSILLVAATILCMPVVYAHDVELDKDDVISVPLDKNNQISSSTKVEVKESFGEYKLSYQYVVFPENDYESFKSIHEDALKYQEDNYPSEDATEEEINEYKDAILEFEASKNKLKPSYDDTKWIVSTDGTVPFIKEKDQKVEKDDPYVLWLKLEKKDAKEEDTPIYDELWVLYNEGMEKDEEPSASTSDNVMVIAILMVAAAGLMAVSYKKSRA